MHSSSNSNSNSKDKEEGAVDLLVKLVVSNAIVLHAMGGNASAEYK